MDENNGVFLMMFDVKSAADDVVREEEGKHWTTQPVRGEIRLMETGVWGWMGLPTGRWGAGGGAFQLGRF
jgi:hypothetical protein